MIWFTTIYWLYILIKDLHIGKYWQWARYSTIIRSRFQYLIILDSKSSKYIKWHQYQTLIGQKNVQYMMRFDICMHAEQVWNANWEEQNGGAMEGASAGFIRGQVIGLYDDILYNYYMMIWIWKWVFGLSTFICAPSKIKATIIWTIPRCQCIPDKKNWSSSSSSGSVSVLASSSSSDTC